MTEAKEGLLNAYADAGGKGPRYCEVALCCAASEEQARETAHHYFRCAMFENRIAPALRGRKAP